MNITSFASKSSYCSKGAPQKSKPELCPYVRYDRCICHGSLRFLAIFSASLLFTLLHSGAVLPVVVKTRGFNEDFSMSITLWLYLSFFSFSCCWLTSVRDLPAYDCEVGCVIYMSKKVVSQLFHSPRAEISNLALSAVLTFL